MSEITRYVKASRYVVELSPKEINCFQRILENTTNPDIAIIQEDEQLLARRLWKMLQQVGWAPLTPTTAKESDNV